MWSLYNHYVCDWWVCMNNEEINNDVTILFKIVDKLEQRIATLEKVIGKLQLTLGDVVLYIDKKGEQNVSK